MLKVNELPQQATCDNCGKNLQGTAIGIETDGHTQTVKLCAPCLEKSARLLRDAQNTKHVIYVIVRFENNRYNPNTITKVFHDKEKAIEMYKKFFEADLETIPKSDASFTRQNFEQNLKKEQYRYLIYKKQQDKFIITELHTNILN